MAEKVTKLTWGAEIEKRLSDFDNLPFLRDCCTKGNGEVYAIGELLIVVRAEALIEGGFEVVWMASHGAGLNQYAPLFIEAAKRNGAKHIRFHCASDELAVPRLVKQFQPREVERVYRIDLGGET